MRFLIKIGTRRDGLLPFSCLLNLHVVYAALVFVSAIVRNLTTGYYPGAGG